MPGLENLNPYVAAANAVGGLISTGVGLFQKHKGNKLLNGLQYPTESLPKEFTENQDMARRRAAEGLPSDQYSQAMRNIQRQQLMALRGAHDRRGGLGALAGIQQGTNDATLNLDVANAQQKIANEQQYMNVNNQVAGQKRDLFDRNVRQKYDRDYNYGMGLLGMGNTNVVSGVDRLASAGIGLAAGGYGRSNSGGGSNYTVGAPINTPAQTVPYQRPPIGGLLPRTNFPTNRNVIIR